MKKLILKKKGFTLIELLVVIAIIMILSFMAINGYVDYRKNTLLKFAGDNLISQIDEQKRKTVYGETPDDSSDDSSKCYGIYIDDSGLHSFYKDFNDTKSYKEGKWVYEGCDMTVVKEGDLTELEMDQMVKIVSVKNVKCEDECEDEDEGELELPFYFSFYPITGDLIFKEEADFDYLIFELQYGDLEEYKKDFKYIY